MTNITASPGWDKPPPGYKPGQTRAPLAWNVTMPLGVLAILLGCLRLYVRTFIVRVVGKDDWLLLSALIFLCLLLGGIAWETALGIGKHQYDLNQIMNPLAFRAPAGIGILSYYMCQACVQCSILAFYLRLGLARIGGHHMRWLIYGIMSVSVLNNFIAATLGMAFSLVNSLVLQSERYLLKLWFVYGALSLSLDLIIWIIPLPTIISTMHTLSTKKKILLGMAFAVGTMCWCSAILRISLRKYVAGISSDPTYNAPIINLLYVSEVSLAICCVSVATLRPLIVKMTKKINKLRGKPTSTNKSRSSGYGFGGSQQSGSRPGGTGNKGRFGEIIVEQELSQWTEDASNIERSQSMQKTSTRGGQLQVPVPAVINHNTTHCSSSASSGETLRVNTAGSHQGAHSQPHCDAQSSTESTANLTSTGSNAIADYA